MERAGPQLSRDPRKMAEASASTSTRDTEDVVATQGRKRTRNPAKWKAKHIRTPGLRKNAPQVDISTFTCCKKKCTRTFTDSHLAKVRSDFEALYYEQQNIYLNGLLHRYETKQSKGHKRKSSPKLTGKGNRLGRPPAEESKFSFSYTLRNDHDFNVKVCQKAFCAMHGFGPKRLQVLRRKIQDASEMSDVVWDKRGKHSNHYKIDEDTRQMVRDHILSFPSRSSHYSRQDNSNRLYLSAELSIAQMYHDFLEKHDPEYVEEESKRKKWCHDLDQGTRKPLISEHFYHDIFVTEFNLHFGNPRSDTCGTCDAFRKQIEDCTNDSDKERLVKEHEAHKELAQDGYSALKEDQELSKQSWTLVSQVQQPQSAM